MTDAAPSHRYPGTEPLRLALEASQHLLETIHRLNTHGSVREHDWEEGGVGDLIANRISENRYALRSLAVAQAKPDCEEMTHTRSCGYFDDEVGCTCCLKERIALSTEQTMHRAWRKRAEEAEAALASAQAVLAPLDCDWPDAPFTFLDEPGEHDPCYVVMPGGAMLSLNHHATPGVDIARAKFIVDACNAALSPDFPRAAVAEAMQDAWNTICADTDCHPLDIERQGKKLFFKPGHWVDLIALFLSRSPSVPSTDRGGK